MAGAQNTKKENNKLQLTNASRDLLVIAAAVTILFAVSYSLNVFGFLVRLFQEKPLLVTYIDEVIVILSALSIGFAVFSWRRWSELKRETAARIKLQEDLIRYAEAKAQAESIINRQLHSEIEQRKHSGRMR